MTHKKTKSLEGRGLQILMFIWDYKEKHPYSPSNREICDAIQTEHHKPISLSVLSWHIRALKKKWGYIDYLERQSRTLHLTPEGKLYVQAFVLPEKIKKLKNALAAADQ